MPEFTAIYRRLGQEHRLPVLLPASLANYNPASYAGTLDHARFDADVAAARAAGEPVFDIVLETPWARRTDAETAYRAMFQAIPDGLTFLSMHFNRPGDFDAINPEAFHIRTEEYALFCTPIIKRWVEELGLEVIGMRTLQEELHGRRATAS